MIFRRELLLHITVDLVILTVRENRLSVLVVERGNEPFRGLDALPGGFLRDRESVADAAVRELAEETGLNGAGLHLEVLNVFSAPDRDPRGRVVSVAYLAIAPDLPTPVAGSDAAGARWAPAAVVRGTLAFDHNAILDDAIERARSRLEVSTLATAFCPPEFTIGDLRAVYETVWGTRLDPRNFARKVAHTAGFVVPTGAKRPPASGRPATLYRRGPATTLNPPLLRGSAIAQASPHALAGTPLSRLVRKKPRGRWHLPAPPRPSDGLVIG